MPDIDDVEKIIAEVSPYYKARAKAKADKKIDFIANREHKLVYNSPSETLEPVYFWILDMMQALCRNDVIKIADNFTSSVGSGHFGEQQGRASQMQQLASKIMGDVNTVLKSILNLIYSLKEFQMRLSSYKLANSDKTDEKEAGILALKQIWMDSVDIKRGNTSIKGLALGGQAPFSMMIDAFMAAKSIDDIDKIDLNDRLKRLLKPRVAEFFEWKDRSEKELTKRYEIEKTYLKSQVNALKLYTSWAKPYLKAAEQLRMKDQTTNPELVNMFNTMILKLTIMGKNKFDFNQKIIDRDYPQEWRDIKLKREYFSVIFVDFGFVGIPTRYQGQQAGHYAFGGKVSVTFRAYALNQDELDLFNEKLNETDLSESFKLIENMTNESVAQIQEDVDYYLNEKDKVKEEQAEEKAAKDVNPFAALLGLEKKKAKKDEKADAEKDEKKKKLKELKEKGVGGDNWKEKYARAGAIVDAADVCYKLYDVYKKGHGMASSPEPVPEVKSEDLLPKGSFLG